MKAPAFLASALGAMKKAGGIAGSSLSGVAGIVKHVASAVAGGLGRVVSSVDRKIIRYVAIAAAAILGFGVIAILIGAVIAGVGNGRDKKAALAAEAAVAVASGSFNGMITVPRSGAALAAMLLIPGDGEWPWPLALEPKERYTEADAAAVRPDMSEVDVSELTRSRKAELEAIFGAVD